MKTPAPTLAPILASAVALFALTLGACNQENPAAQSNGVASAAETSTEMKSEGKVVAVVNGVELTDMRVSVYLKGLPPLQDDGHAEVIENMISSELLAQAAAQEGLKDELREDMLVAQQAVLVRAYLNNYLLENPVSEEDIKAHYEKALADNTLGGGGKEYLVSHILLPDEEKAKTALADVQKNPESFGDIAKERSEDKGSGQNGGDIGWSSPQNLVPPFAEAMQKMKPGEISSAPVQTRFGWHIIHLREVRDTEPPALDARLRQRIQNEERNAKVTKHIEDLRAAATVELKEEN